MSKIKGLDKAIDAIVKQIQEDTKPVKEPVENIKAVTELTISNKQGKAKQTTRKGVDLVQDKKKRKESEIRKFRREASRMASMANKRVERLEKNGFYDSPAYRGYIASGGGRFGVKGKTYNEVQAEVARMRAFIEANTSTISGLNNYLKGMAENTGIKYSNMQDLYKKSGKFFELSNKVEEYLRTVEDMASAIGYQKIWEAVNTYTKQNKIDLSDANLNIDNMISQISDALTEHQKPENLFLKEGAFVTESGVTQSTWFKLKID